MPLVSQRDIARLLKRSTTQVQNLVAKGLPRDARTGRYDEAAVVEWWTAYKSAEAVRKAAPVGAKQAQQAKNRRQIAEARITELALAKEEGSLVSIEYLEEQLEACIDRLRAKLINMPGKIAPGLIGLTTISAAQSVVQQAIAEAMAALVETGEEPELDLGPESIEASEAA